MEQQIISLVHQYSMEGEDSRCKSSLAAWTLLNSPYFQGKTQQCWKLMRVHEMYKGPIGESIDLIQMWRDEFLLRTPQKMYDGRWGWKVYGGVEVEEIPAPIVRGAEDIIKQIRRVRPDIVDKLMQPTQDDLGSRHRFEFEVVRTLDLDSRLAQILGDDYRIDARLRLQGHEYHTAPSYGDTKGCFILAHNGHELAGILHLSDYRPQTYGVNYVSVAPSFRKMGVGGGMFKKAIEVCVQDKRIMSRTGPSEYAEQRPAIPGHFDRLCKGAPLLFAQSNSPLLSHMEKSAKEHGYDQIFGAYKHLCDHFATGEYRDVFYGSELTEALDGVSLGRKAAKSRARP